MKIKRLRFTFLALLATAGSVQAGVITFDDLSLPPNSFFDPQANVSWNSGGVTFEHTWNDTFNCCWGGVTYSNSTDTTTPGFLNDRSAITGDGVGDGQDNYAVIYVDAGTLTLGLHGPRTVLGAFFTNTTYAFLAMAEGDDGNDPPFVKGPFTDGDFLNLIVGGLDASEQAVGTSVNVALADGDDVLDDWLWVDLSGLGEISALTFTLESSDNDPTFGINTPPYIAIDNLSIVPLPAAAWLFLSALFAAARFARPAAGS